MIEVIIRENVSTGATPAFPERSLGTLPPSDIRALVELLNDAESPAYIGDGDEDYVFSCAYLDLSTGKYVIMFEKNS